MQKYYGYIVWLGIVVFIFFEYALNSSAGVFAKSIQHALSLSEVEASAAMGAYVIGYALMQIPAGALIGCSPSLLLLLLVFYSS